MRSLPDASLDAVIADPPYGIDYQPKFIESAPERKRRILNDGAPFVWFLPECYRVLKEGSGLVCFCRWDVQEDFRRAIDLAGFRVRSQIVWDREVHGMGNCKAQFAPQHDVAWFATKGRFAFPNGRPRSVIRAKRAPSHELRHPTEKPVDLLRPLVVALTRPGETVLDPFGGCGSTGEAAAREGRGYLLIEQDPDHCATAAARLGIDVEVAS